MPVIAAFAAKYALHQAADNGKWKTGLILLSLRPKKQGRSFNSAR
jgi:hypothetical protein